MEYKALVEGAKVSALGLGTWTMGGRSGADSSRDDEEIEAIRAGIDLGMTHIDTAEYYGAGHAEELVGEAIKAYDRRDLFITTKVWRNHMKYVDLIASMKASLKRLDLDYVDLYLIHWPNPEVPLAESMRGLEHCVEEGYTRLIGVSNFSASLLKEAQTHLRDHRIVSDQVEYNLMEQGPRKELLPYCIENNVMLIAYTPLAKGRLAKLGYHFLDSLAEKYGKTQSQVSLNWLISQENVITIPKASKLKHLRDNVGAVGWRLNRDDFKKLTNAFR